MKEKYVIENECNDYIQVVLLTEEQAKAIDWVINTFDMDGMTINKVDEYPATSIDWQRRQIKWKHTFIKMIKILKRL